MSNPTSEAIPFHPSPSNTDHQRILDLLVKLRVKASTTPEQAREALALANELPDTDLELVAGDYPLLCAWATHARNSGTDALLDLTDRTAISPGARVNLVLACLDDDDRRAWISQHLPDPKPAPLRSGNVLTFAWSLASDRAWQAAQGGASHRDAALAYQSERRAQLTTLRIMLAGRANAENVQGASA